MKIKIGKKGVELTMTHIIMMVLGLAFLAFMLYFSGKVGGATEGTTRDFFRFIR